MGEANPRFQVGDRVRVKLDNPNGNPRTPHYIRGKEGVVGEVQGIIPNSIDHHGVYPTLYSVLFDGQHVFGQAANYELSVDLHDEWLDPA